MNIHDAVRQKCSRTREICLGLFHVMFAALPPRSLSGCLPGSCNGGATKLNSPSHKVMDFSVFEQDWRDLQDISRHFKAKNVTYSETRPMVLCS